MPQARNLTGKRDQGCKPSLHAILHRRSLQTQSRGPSREGSQSWSLSAVTAKHGSVDGSKTLKELTVHSWVDLTLADANSTPFFSQSSPKIGNYQKSSRSPRLPGSFRGFEKSSWLVGNAGLVTPSSFRIPPDLLGPLQLPQRNGRRGAVVGPWRRLWLPQTPGSLAATVSGPGPATCRVGRAWPPPSCRRAAALSARPLTDQFEIRA